MESHTKVLISYPQSSNWEEAVLFWTSCVKNMIKNIICKIFTNILEYSQIYSNIHE